MTIVYQVVLKRKDNNYEEVVGQTLDREQADTTRDYYNTNEDNKMIYYLVKSAKAPKAKKRDRR